MLSEKIWKRILEESQEVIERDPSVLSLFNQFVLRYDNFLDALTNLFSAKLNGDSFLSYSELLEIATDTMREDLEIIESAARDIQAFFERDPACTKYLEPFLFYKGFIAVQCYRIASYKYFNNQIELANNKINYS